MAIETLITILKIENLNSWQSLLPDNYEIHWTAFAILAMFNWWLNCLSKGFYQGRVRVGICILSSSCIHSRSPRSPFKKFGIKYAHGLFCLQSYIQHGQIKYVRWSQIIFCNVQEIPADTHEGRPKSIFCQGIIGQTFYYWVLKTFKAFGMFIFMVQTKSWAIKTNKFSQCWQLEV